MSAIRALSIRQPWAYAIAHLGKDVENRNWRTGYRGPVLIHAARGMTRVEFEDAAEHIHAVTGRHVRREDLDFGGIIGRATLVDCVQDSTSRWFEGPYGFVLTDAAPVPFRPCRGALGFFEVER